MSIKIKKNNNKANSNLPFQKEKYVSFNSANPYNYNPRAFKIKKDIRLEKGIVKDVKDGNVIISCSNRELDIKVHFTRSVDQLTLVSKTHVYLCCAEEPRVLWYDLEGYPEGAIIQFDSKGRSTGHIKAITAPKEKKIIV